MNMKLLGAFVLALFLVMVLPLIGGVLQSSGTSAQTQAFVPPANAGAVASAGTAPVAPTAPVEAEVAIPSVVDAPPMLDEVSLIGTAWRVTHNMGAIDVNFMGNGVAQAYHMLLGNIQGAWRVEGADVVITATVMSKTETIKVAIRGTDLYANGVAIQRLR